MRIFENALGSQTPFDLVLIDIHLPHPNELDILGTLTRIEKAADVSHSIDHGDGIGHQKI